jgi:peptidoglycan/xylan/chitin deacetylase (PgdA/CDA1 family)
MKKIAFTFDDGPNTTVTPKVLDLFEKYEGKASFFLIGQNIKGEAVEVMKRAAALGCDLENHSFTHPAMPDMSEDEIKEEISKTTRLIETNTDKKVHFFRPPYIAYNEKMAKLIDYVFICGTGCDDWDENICVEKRYDTIKNAAKDGLIVLLHDSDYNFKTVEMLERLLPELKADGYEFVTISELFDAYCPNPEIHTGKIYSEINN